MTEIRQFGDIALFKSPRGRIMGFHGRNMELAELTEDHWSGHSENELLEWHKEDSPTVRDAEAATGVSHLSINIAQLCNLRCTYCAADGDGTYGSSVKKIDLKKATTAIDSFLRGESSRFHLQFLGGEPLLYPRIIRELCQHAKLQIAGTRKSIYFSVTTNGTLITASVAEMLAEFNFTVVVSVDGAKEINDRTRPALGKRSSTEMTLEGLSHLRAVQNRLAGINANCVFGRHNMDILGAWEFLNSTGVEWSGFNFNFANNDSDDELTKNYVKQMNRLAGEVYDLGGIEALAKIAQFERVFTRLAAQTRIYDYCGAEKSLLQLDTKGGVYGCNWFMNDPNEKLNRGKLSLREKSIIEMNDCGRCWARHLCGGGCMAVNKAFSGSKHGKDPRFCFRTRQLAVTAMNHYAQAFN